MPNPRYRVASPPTGRPLLLWDGDCGFCRLWAERWREAYGEQVDFATTQSLAARFPEIPASAYDKGIQLIEPDGGVYSGAAAALRTRMHGRGRRDPLLWAYEKIPGVAQTLEAGYGVIARHRPFFSRLTRWFCGPNIFRPRFSVGAAAFLRVLAVVYFVAFASLWWQLSGLIGPDGILPAQPYLDTVAKQLKGDAWWRLPTLCWIFGAGKFLHVLCAGGVALSLALFLRFAQPLCLLLLWLFYLSLCGAGQIFLGYQWDALLLETGLLAVFLGPWRLRATERREPPRYARWLLGWLLFRLMFMSGWVKLASGDAAWNNFTALTFHFQTQPLPTWLAWHAHQLPVWWQKLACAAMFVIEFAAPFLLFGPRRLRLGAALSLIALQLLIALTGNYTFFNLLTVALCLLFLDDAWWSRWFGVAPLPYAAVSTCGHGAGFLEAGFEALRKIVGAALRRDSLKPSRRKAAPTVKHDEFAAHRPPLQRWLRGAIVGGFFTASVVVTLPNLIRARQWPDWFASVHGVIGSTRSVNSYGLFAVMTTSRPEIVIEGSRDGRTWETYEFKWKPGDLQRRPGFVAPHQPRLDWQLWFAALTYPQYEPWVQPFLRHLAANTPAVTRLLRRNPFAKEPPRYLRAVLHEYKFTTPAERARTGAWWKRSPIDYYLQPTPVR